MAINGRLFDAAPFRLFQKLVADSVVYPKGDQLYVNYNRLRKAIARGLALLDSDRRFDDELIDALHRLSVTITVEAVCLRRNPDTDGMEVLLTKRPDDKPDHPDRWYCPGITKQPGESDDQALDRVGQALAANLGHRKRLGSSGHYPPGHCQRRFYRCEVADGAKGTWFPVIDLPVMNLTDWDVAIFIRTEATSPPGASELRVILS